MPKWISNITTGVGNGVVWFLVKAGIRPKVRYVNKERKNCRYDEPVIFVGNHTSHWDGLMTSVEFRKAKAHILVAKDWYEKKSVNWYLKHAKCIPMDRFGIDTNWLRMSRAAIKDKNSVIIYPEGKTSENGNLHEFKSGFVMLALMTGAKVVPYAVHGKYKLFFGRRLRVLVGEPMELSAEGKGMSPEYMEAESDRFKNIVTELVNTLKGDR